jgi:S-DNA-T family DNA segregation ATPase FtsK/SpoIIIE
MVFHLDRVVSVTELRNALRCPRVLALGRSARRAVTFPLGSSCLGAAFHRIVDRFARTVDSPPRGFSSLPEAVPDDRVKAELARWILGFLIDELEANSHYATMPAEVDDLAEALREYAGYLAERVVAFGGKPAETICSVVRSGEHDVEATFEEVGLVLRGRIDALLGTRGSELQVVEYKLTDEANEPLDVAQVALYRELLARGPTRSGAKSSCRYSEESEAGSIAPDQPRPPSASTSVPRARSPATAGSSTPITSRFGTIPRWQPRGRGRE